MYKYAKKSTKCTKEIGGNTKNIMGEIVKNADNSIQTVEENTLDLSLGIW